MWPRTVCKRCCGRRLESSKGGPRGGGGSAMTRCPSRRQRQHLLGGLVNDAERKDVVGHAGTCLPCRKTLARLTDDGGADWRGLGDPAPTTPTASQVDFLRRV